MKVTVKPYFRPHDTLTFSVQQSNAESLPQAIKMVNNREVQVAYKVKTTAPEHYRVKPTVGIIEPGQECEVSVQLTPGKKCILVLIYESGITL